MSKINIKLSDWVKHNVVRIKLSDWIRKEKNLPLEIDAIVLEEREKAIRVEYLTTNTVWLPKSQIKIETTGKQEE